jgi:hypothetical protein
VMLDVCMERTYAVVLEVYLCVMGWLRAHVQAVSATAMLIFRLCGR